jgi:phenylalanyl-tRNA synthetase beta chain
MRLVLSWLREFVDITRSAGEIAGTLGLRGFEVASVETLEDGEAVIDFEITANRPDCLSVLGLAREVSTAFGVPLRVPSADSGATVRLASLPTGRSGRLTVTIEDDDLCPRYAGAVADVKIGASPAWLARRLHRAGVRPISNIVDITNYVNLEIGQPMHAFDLARLAGSEIHVRRARPGETIRTLDSVDRQLESDMLVIADRDRAQAIAGVMGGADSEVSSGTTQIVLESAYFKSTSVRRTSKRLALKTEASSRFERGADIGAQVVAIERAAQLIEQLGVGRVDPPVVDCYPRRRTPTTLHLRRDRLARLLGASVPDSDVVRILTALGLQVLSGSQSRRDGVGWDVVVPSFRVDLLREVDLIEEVGRHYGFDRLTPTFPALTSPPPAPDPRIRRDELVRRVAAAAGLSEAVTFGFIESRAADAFHATGAGTPIAIANPLSAKFDTLRPSLIPGLVDVVAHNRHHGRRDVRLFEIGTRFGTLGEVRGVAMAWTGAATAEHWSAPPREVDFYDVTGLVDEVCRCLDVSIRTAPAEEPFLVPGQTASVIVDEGPSKGTVVGIMGQLSPAVADGRGLPRQDRVFVAELDLDKLERARGDSRDATRPLPRYPSVVRDLSIVVSGTLPAEIIRGTIQSAAGAHGSDVARLVGISFFDRYQGKGVPDESVSLSIRLTFQSDDRTLTDAEVQERFDTILAALAREHGAIQR